MERGTNISNIQFFPDVAPGPALKKILEFDIGTLWQHAFGYTGLPMPAGFFKLPPSYKTADPLDVKWSVTPRANKLEMRGGSGTPIYIENKKGTLTFLPTWINELYIPICTVSGGSRKSIVKTPLIGAKGIVKEQVAVDDYVFTIKGMLIGGMEVNGNATFERDWPEAAIVELRKLYEEKRAVKLKNAFTDIFLKDSEEDTNLIIEELDFPELVGVEHVRPFVMKVSSDDVLDLYIE